ncbi:MAG: H-type lectin domain-containing protein [Gemmataceae bacterium]|nr:H-type lectin domain-containing protein [Gemmataceae bacterium]MCI0739856.1 H-type lectin domain-containing protein [Gemmataceae bacterium]
MDTLLQIIGGIAVAAITAMAAYLYHLDKKITRMDNRWVRIGDVRFPKSHPKAHEFYGGKHKGRRELSVDVKFDVPFPAQPKVIVSLQKIDLGDPRANIHRISVRAEDVRRDGFVLVFETWEDSQVYDAVASWIAVGE